MNKNNRMKFDELKNYAINSFRKLNSNEFNGYTGWINLPNTIKHELPKIKRVAKEIKDNSDVLVVIGVGGSYLGARAVIEALTNKYNQEIEIIYLGNSLSALDMKDALDYLKTKDFSVNVISKSGSTLEPSIAFDFIKKLMFEKYKESEAFDRMIITTDKEKGTLREYAEDNRIKSFVIPSDIGGRYSVLTSVGLLPIATAGIDVESIILGAQSSIKHINKNYRDNIAIDYATTRYMFYKDGYNAELFAIYEPRLKFFAEWWKQLYGESEGKNGKGLLPTSAIFTSDLHSIGQFIQDGDNNLIETHLTFSDIDEDLKVSTNDNQLKYLNGKSLNEMNLLAKQGTIDAHLSGGVHSIEIKMEKLNEFSIGSLIYMFQVSCSISSIMMDVNPFDQPGVEEYKANLSKLLKE